MMRLARKASLLVAPSLLTLEVSAVSPLTDVDALFRAGVQSRHRF
jgi:hypothetical protein